MLQFLRKHSKSWLVLALFGLLILSFGLWGVADVYSPGQMGRDIVAEVGDSEITGSEFQREFQRNVNQFAQTFGQLDSDQFLRQGIAEQTLARLINLAAMDQAGSDLGLTVSADALRRAIRETPSFQGSDGRYDPNIARNVITGSGFSEAAFSRLLAGDLMREQLVGSLVGNPPAPDAIVDPLWRYREERRTGAMLPVPLPATGAVAAPDAAALQAYYEENRDRFMAPEYRRLSAVVLARADIAGEIAIDDDTVRQAFDQRAEALGTPERRRVDQLLAPDAATAEILAGRLAEGATFEGLAETDGVQRIDLGMVTAADLPIEEIADAVFAAAPGTVTAPVESPLGFHLLRVGAVEPGVPALFADHREAIARELAEEQALDRMFELANRLEDELGGGGTLEEAARVLGLTPATIGPVDSRGNGPDGTALTDIPVGPALLREAWQLEDGATSGLLEGETDQFYVVRVDAVIPPALRPFADVEDAVRSAVIDARRRAAAETRGTALLERAQSGETLERLAGEAGGSATAIGPVTRAAGETGGVDPAVLSALFAMKADESRLVATATGYALVRLTAVSPPSRGESGSARAQISADISAQLTANIGSQFNDALREQYGVSVNQLLLDAIVNPDAAANAQY